MAEMKAYVSDALDSQLREVAMKRFGYGRGSISKAVATAIVQWLAREDAVQGALDTVVARAKSDVNVVAVLLFGSYARREPGYRDVDVALVLRDQKEGDTQSFEEAAAGRGALRSPGLDMVVFNSLPLDVQSRALQEGVVIYARDEAELRRVAAEVAEKWGDFAPTLRYLARRG